MSTSKIPNLNEHASFGFGGALLVSQYYLGTSSRDGTGPGQLTPEIRAIPWTPDVKGISQVQRIPIAGDISIHKITWRTSQ